MATLPKWQEPLVAQAAKAEQTLRAVMHAPGGGAGAFAAAAAADQDLAELCRAVAARMGSPLLQQLLMHGARALDAHAGVLLASTIDPDDLVVALPVVGSDEGQALPEAAPVPAETSDDVSVNESAQASPDNDETPAELPAQCDDCETTGRNCRAHRSEAAAVSLADSRPTVAQAIADAAGATVVHRGAVYEPVAEQSPTVLDAEAESVRDTVFPSGPEHWEAGLDEVADRVESVRMDVAHWKVRDDHNAVYARQSADDALAGIDRCVQRLLTLRADLLAEIASADAARADPDRGAP